MCNSYSFHQVIIPPEETERGLLILPEEQFVAMLDTPVTGRMVFNQFLANLSGSVECIGMCVRKSLLAIFVLVLSLQHCTVHQPTMHHCQLEPCPCSASLVQLEPCPYITELNRGTPV